MGDQQLGFGFHKLRLIFSASGRVMPPCAPSHQMSTIWHHLWHTGPYDLLLACDKRRKAWHVLGHGSPSPQPPSPDDKRGAAGLPVFTWNSSPVGLSWKIVSMEPLLQGWETYSILSKNCAHWVGAATVRLGVRAVDAKYFRLASFACFAESLASGPATLCWTAALIFVLPSLLCHLASVRLICFCSPS